MEKEEEEENESIFNFFFLVFSFFICALVPFIIGTQGTGR
jgi:hypothetical protein